MTFFVDPEAVARLGDLAGRAADEARAMHAHFDQHAHLDFTGEGLINLFRGGDDRNEAIVRDFLAHLAGGALGGTAAAVDAAVVSYRRTDSRGAARLDAELVKVDPSATVGYGDLAGYRDYPGLFRDAEEPTRNLTPPPNYNHELPPEPNWMELVTPAGALRQAVIEVTTFLAAIDWLPRPFDPYELVLKPLCGDWAGMATIGHVLTQEATALADLHQNLWWAAEDVDQAWRGNAADAVTVHLHGLCGSVDQARQVLEAMSLEYFKAAHGAYEVREVVGVLLTEALDTAAKVLVMSAAAGGLAASGVGVPLALLGALWIGSDLYRIANLCGSMLETVHRLVVAAEAFHSAANDFGLIGSDFNLPTLPTAPVLVG